MSAAYLYFAACVYLFFRLGTVKSRWRLLSAAVAWASAESMRIVETGQLTYLEGGFRRRGPDRIKFRASNLKGEVYEICLEVSPANVQSIANIWRTWDGSYDTKLISKTHTGFFSDPAESQQIKRPQ